MRCPFCQHQELKVTDSRYACDLNGIKRRRECLSCNRRFTTFETVDLTVQVLKKDGRYEEFQQKKLVNGLESACRHTKISRDQVMALASEITGELTEKGIRSISTEELGDIVMDKLQKLDPIAYIRFACVYRRFKEMDELMDAINTAKSSEDKNNKVCQEYANAVK